jgi:type I restriction enzyme S subunit
MSARLIRIGDILSRVKNRIHLDDKEIYRQVTVKMNYKGVILRGKQYGATIGTKEQYLISSGQFLLSKIDARNGAFGIVPDDLNGAIITNSFLAFDINKTVVNAEFFNVLLQSPVFLDACIRASKGTTNRKPINEKFLLDYEVHIPQLNEQEKVIKKINDAKVHINQIRNEISAQEKCLQDLKAGILRDAIFGKLTSSWRKNQQSLEPASGLLNQIQGERAELIRQKIFKREKPLPKLTSKDIPFQLPALWEWCRFGSYARFERGKFSARPRNDRRYFGGNYPFIQIGSLDSKGSVINTSPQTLNEEGLKVSKLFEAGTVMVAIVGGTIGNIGVLGRDMCFTDSIVGIRPTVTTCQEFILLMMKAKQAEIKSVAYQRAGQPNISLPNLTDIVIPLPPLDEQREIVKKVNLLIDGCNEIQQHLLSTKNSLDSLLQGVLRKVFQ